MRRLVVLAFLLAAVGVLALQRQDNADSPAGGEVNAEPPAVREAFARMHWVATARQRGVVGYRDPVGAISPSGDRIAYAEGRDLRIVPVQGGSTVASVAVAVCEEMAAGTGGVFSIELSTGRVSA